MINITEIGTRNKIEDILDKHNITINIETYARGGYSCSSVGMNAPEAIRRELRSQINYGNSIGITYREAIIRFWNETMYPKTHEWAE